MKSNKKLDSQVEIVAGALEGYAKRGVFRGFSRGKVGGGKAAFRIVWHRDRTFELIFDQKAGTLRIGELLVNIAADSSMYRELKQFIKSRQSEELPEHRRIDSSRARVQSYNRAGSISLVLRTSDGDYEYGTRKLIHLVHEIFMTFLVDGNYFEYLVEAFDLDPDRM